TSIACFDVVELKLIVYPLPNPQIDPEYFICEDYQTGTLLNPATLDTGISGANYLFEWTLDGTPYGGNKPFITTSQIGNYTVKITNTITTCVNTATTKVSKYAPYLEVIYSDAFENPTFITVNVLGVGSGNYEYKLDNFLYQDSNVFNNVSPGQHLISVQDKDGHCNPAPINAVIINYPKFFTPNGDGYNETWNIPHLLSTNPNAPIFIYDRYGKLLKEISPSSEGWNGTYNGQPLPASDYWFTVDYDEKDISKIFKSHFSLKR
ncbi:MAG: T9SS type B sorting domain-containing protein, partial [Flavobacteriaceae bacterium]|nr:T9SS type B sorting domain-containing protein [Flavobacteriaceae bacterium]